MYKKEHEKNVANLNALLEQKHGISSADLSDAQILRRLLTYAATLHGDTYHGIGMLRDLCEDLNQSHAPTTSSGGLISAL